MKRLRLILILMGCAGLFLLGGAWLDSFHAKTAFNWYGKHGLVVGIHSGGKLDLLISDTVIPWSKGTFFNGNYERSASHPESPVFLPDYYYSGSDGRLSLAVELPHWLLMTGFVTGFFGFAMLVESQAAMMLRCRNPLVPAPGQSSSSSFF